MVVVANPVAHFLKYYLLQWEVCKGKSLMNSKMTLTVYAHSAPKGATTKIEVKTIKRDIKIIILFSDNLINNTVIQDKQTITVQ